MASGMGQEWVERQRVAWQGLETASVVTKHIDVAGGRKSALQFFFVKQLLLDSICLRLRRPIELVRECTRAHLHMYAHIFAPFMNNYFTGVLDSPALLLTPLLNNVMSLYTAVPHQRPAC